MADEEDRIGRLGKRLDAEFARSVQRYRANRPKAQSVSVELTPTVLGAWGSLAESVAVFAAQSAGVPGAAAASKIILALVGVQDAQSVMLTHIRRDVELLRKGPFRSAQEQLAIAGRIGSADAEYGNHLREAERLLVMAIGQSASIEESSVIEFNLGLVEAVRGYEEEARHRLKGSYRYCVNVTEELISRATNIKVFKDRSTAAVTVQPIVASVVGIRKWLKTLNAHDAAIALEGYVPFVNTVARAGNAMERSVTRPGLVLRGSFAEGYEVEWIVPPSISLSSG